MKPLPVLQWNDLSRHRGELMGLAMLFVILFHVYVPRHDIGYGIHRLGNIGVDLFLFLSGVGLWYSWSNSAGKAPSAGSRLLSFWKRRYIRIFPAWLIVACAYYLPRYSGDVRDTATDILVNLDFWTQGELTFWYLPAIMALYLIAPLYMQLVERAPVWRWTALLPVVWCIAVQWVMPLHASVGHLEIFWSRVPVFLLGLNAGAWVKDKRREDTSAFGLVLLIWIATFALCLYLEQVRHGKFPLFVERMVYIPLTVSTLLLLGRLCAGMPKILNRLWAFIGTVSLEVYLLHSEFILKPLERLHLGYWPTFFAVLVVALPTGWCLHKVIDWIEKQLVK